MVRGFFASLFGRRHKRNFEPTVAFALRSALESGLLRAGVFAEKGLAGSIQCEAIDLDTLLQEVHRSGPGWMTVFHRDTDLPELIILTPKTFGSLERAVAVWDGADSFLSVVPSFGPARHRYYRMYVPGDADELAWRLSGCRGYRLQADGLPCVFACAQEKTAAAFERVLTTDRKLQEVLRNLLSEEAGGTRPQSARQAPGRAPQTLRLLAPRESALVDLLLPPRIPCGSRTLESLATSLSTDPDPAGMEEAAGVWIGATFTSHGRRFALYYFFASRDPTRVAAMRDACKAVASCILRASLPRLASALGCRVENPSLDLDAKPAPTARARCIAVCCRVRLGDTGSTLHLLCDASLILALAARAKDRATVAATAKAALPTIPLVLGLPGPLAADRMAGFVRSFIDPRLGVEHFPFGLFADLITERDLALVVQNHIQRAGSGRCLKRLYAWTEESTDQAGRRELRSVVPQMFDEERLLSQLPAQAQEAWKRCGVRQLGSRTDFIQENQLAFKAINQAACNDALLLSPRARWLLTQCVMPPLRAASLARLKTMTDSGRPFALLRSLRRPQVQQLLATQPNRTLCLALLNAQVGVALVSANVSSRRWHVLGQDVSTSQKQLDAGLLDVDEVIEAKCEIELVAQAILARVEARPRPGGHGA